MTVLLATLLLDVADTPPSTADEAGIEDETVIKPIVSNSFLFELGTRRLVMTFRKRLIGERDDEDHMTGITMELLAKTTNGLAASERCIGCFSPTPIPHLVPNKGEICLESPFPLDWKILHARRKEIPFMRHERRSRNFEKTKSI